MVSRFLRLLVWALFVFLIGGFGGIVLDRVLLPKLSGWPVIQNIPFLKNATRGITVIQPTREIIVKESEALPRAIEKVTPSVVGIARERNEKVVARGSGIVITADGLILTDSELVLGQGNLFVLREGRELEATLSKLSAPRGLALLAVAERNLPVVSFIEEQDLSLGTEVFVLSRGEKQQRILTLAIVTAKDPVVAVDLLGDFPQEGYGAAVATTDGRIVGMARKTDNGALNFVPAADILSFLAESQ